jgi:hypothetical protein
LILFDDEVWREVSAPWIEVDYSVLGGLLEGQGTTMSIRADFRKFSTTTQDHSPSGLFTSGRFALASINILAQRFPDAEGGARFQDLEVLIPSAVAFDDLDDFVRRAAATISESTRREIGSFPSKAVDRILALRQYASPDSRETVICREAAIETLRAFLISGVWSDRRAVRALEALDAYGP